MVWQIDFFVDIRGKAPVQDFLESLSAQPRAKLLALIKMLEQEGPNLPFPYSSHVRGKLRELRTQQGKDKLRILYFGDAKRQMVLLHGFVKRSAKLPEEDMRIAESRMESHNKRIEGKAKMTSRWNKFYVKQMEDPKMRDLVERELDNLQLGVQIAKLRAAEKLSQTKLAALADMSAPKISAMENEPRNLTIGTLIRVAHALGSRVEIKLVKKNKARRGDEDC